MKGAMLGCHDFSLGLAEGGILRYGSGRLLVLQDMIPAKLSGGNEIIHIRKKMKFPKNVTCVVAVQLR